jgi:hypothetical protein
MDQGRPPEHISEETTRAQINGDNSVHSTTQRRQLVYGTSGDNYCTAHRRHIVYTSRSEETIRALTRRYNF